MSILKVYKKYSKGGVVMGIYSLQVILSRDVLETFFQTEFYPNMNIKKIKKIKFIFLPTFLGVY